MRALLRHAVVGIALIPSSWAATVPSAKAPASDQPPTAVLKTLMCERGKLLFSDDFTAASFAKNWFANFGTWECRDDAVRVSGPSGEHHPLKGHHLAVQDAIVQVDVKFDGTDWLGVGWDNDPRGHLIRCNLNPGKWDISRWFTLFPGSKDNTLDSHPADFVPARWYTLVWEIRGTESLASIDERLICYGQMEGVDLSKSTLTLFSNNGAGHVAWFAHLKVWEVTGFMPDWEKRTRARVQEVVKKER